MSAKPQISASQRKILIAAASAPLGALALSLAGVDIGGQDPKLVGAVLGAAAGYFVGGKYVGYGAGYSYSSSAIGPNVLTALSLASLGYLYGPSYGYSPLMGAAGGALAGVGANQAFGMYYGYAASS